MPEPSATAGPVVLEGRWPAAHVDALAAAFTLVDAAVAGGVEWLLVLAGADGAARVRALAGRLRDGGSPALRVAVVDPAGHWSAGEWSAGRGDLYIAGDVLPRELVAALWLGGRGFRVGRPAAAHAGLPAVLTARENELLQALCAGLSNDRIARELRISRSTVEFHLTRIFRKLRVRSRAEAIVQAGGRAGTPCPCGHTA